MAQQLKHILQWSLTFVTSVYAKKFIYIITLKVCASLAMTCTAMICNEMICNAMTCHTMQRHAMQRHDMQCNAMRCIALQCNDMHCNACDEMACDAMACNAMTCDAVTCNAVTCHAMQWHAMSGQQCMSLHCYTSQWLWRHTCWSPLPLESSVDNQMNNAGNNPVLNSILTGLSSNSVTGRWIPNRTAPVWKIIGYQKELSIFWSSAENQQWKNRIFLILSAITENWYHQQPERNGHFHG